MRKPCNTISEYVKLHRKPKRRIMTIKAGEGTRKYSLYFERKFKLIGGIWDSWYNGEYKPFYTTPKTHRQNVYHHKQIQAR